MSVDSDAITMEFLGAVDTVRVTAADSAGQGVTREFTVSPGKHHMLQATFQWIEPGLSIPVVAVNRLAGQYFVFVAERAEQGFVARQTPVTLGEIVGEVRRVRT